MLAKIEAFLFEKFVGKLLARAAVTIAAYVAGPVVQGLAGKVGVSISVNPGELEAALILAAHAAYESYKAWRKPAPVAPVTPA